MSDNVVNWTAGQLFVWILFFAAVLVGVVSVFRAGAVLAAHQAALVGGRAALGPEQGYAQAGSDLATWWGITPSQTAQVVMVEPEPARRSLRVRIEGAIRTLLGGSAALGAGSYQRLEDFYPGPPDEWE